MIRRLARILLAAVFVSDGIEALRDPAAHQEVLAATVVPLAERQGRLPRDPRAWAQIVGGIQACAGALLALGKLRRLSALALLATLAPPVYARRDAWRAGADAPLGERARPLLQDLGLAGSLLLAAVDRGGRPSLGWRARRGARHAGQAVTAGRQAVTAAVPGAARAGRAAARS